MLEQLDAADANTLAAEAARSPLPPPPSSASNHEFFMGRGIFPLLQVDKVELILWAEAEWVIKCCCCFNLSCLEEVVLITLVFVLVLLLEFFTLVTLWLDCTTLQALVVVVVGLVQEVEAMGDSGRSHRPESNLLFSCTGCAGGGGGVVKI